jgi:C2 domain
MFPVKRAKFISDQASQFNTYVTLKLQNVKTTTQTVKGAEPVWNQDFLLYVLEPNPRALFDSFIELHFICSETSTIHTGLVVEVWSKNIILDRVLGFQFIPLDSLPYNQYDYPNSFEQWLNIDAEQVIVNGEVGGTRDPTGHSLLLDIHFEMPFGEFSLVFCSKERL